MRARVDARRVHAFLEELGRATHVPTRLYLVGGATSVLNGWRESTVDIDLRLEPDSDELLRAIPRLKEQLDLNVELASPPDFIPELPGWRERSPYVVQVGHLEVRHFDPYSQALSKVERGFEQDLEDVQAMLREGLVEPERARALFAEIRSQLHRYPAIDPGAFGRKVEAAFG